MRDVHAAMHAVTDAHRKKLDDAHDTALAEIARRAADAARAADEAQAATVGR